MTGHTRKYLITGAAGFIGSNFVHLLYQKEKNARVTVLDKLTYAGNPENLAKFRRYRGFEFIKGDICDARMVKRAMAGADVVVNFAAESAVDRSIDDPDSFLKTDLFGVYTLLNEARRQKQLQRFIQISTDEVYGQTLKGSFSEISELKPRNPYSASKAGGDRLAYSFFATYGLPVIITRASNTYGPFAYLEKVIPLFITNLIDGEKIPVYGQGRQIRDWLYVDDHCSGIYLLITKGKNGEVYNIAGNQELMNIDLARRILRLLGKSETSVKFVGDRPGHDFRYSLNTSKIRKIGWRPQFDVDTGLRKTVEWYLKNERWWKPIKRKMEQRYLTGYWGKKK